MVKMKDEIKCQLDLTPFLPLYSIFNHQNQTSATIMTTPNNTSRYISRLRRAFLLRVHPDRFRAQSEHVRREQAVLVQMLSDRLGEQDFLEFATPSLR